MRVNPNPSFSIKFAPCEALVFDKEVYTPADLGMEISEEMGEEYLELDEPFEISFGVNSEASKGEYLLEGKVNYFICSKEEGWCLKSSSQFSVPFKIEAIFRFTASCSQDTSRRSPGCLSPGSIESGRTAFPLPCWCPRSTRSVSYP